MPVRPRLHAMQLRLLLWLITAHSALVGLTLLLLPVGYLSRLGFAPIAEPFFVAQGGVFHLAMCLVYGLGASNPERHRAVVWVALGAKATALLFLSLYFLFVSPLMVVLLSGLADGAMALLLWITIRGFMRQAEMTHG